MEINSSGLGWIHLKIDIILKIKEDLGVPGPETVVKAWGLLSSHHLLTTQVQKSHAIG